MPASIVFESPSPILAKGDAEIDELDRFFDTGKGQKIAEGRRIEFYQGKRKLKNGTLKKTNNVYWQWVYKDPDTGKRKRPYGGTLATVPSVYQYRIRQYQAVVNSRGVESLADALLRPALDGVRNIDTGKA